MPPYFSHCKKIASRLGSFFFPSFCYGCGNEGTLLCRSCQDRLPLLPPTCFVCQKIPTSYGQRCFSCEGNTSSLDAVFGSYCYGIPVIQKLIHGYKYHFITSSERAIEPLFEKGLLQGNLPLPHIIVPVPLHRRRLRLRGFNQSLFLATVARDSFSSHIPSPIVEALVRTRFTKPQQKTHSKKERLANLANAFAVPYPENVKNKVVWLVDDVATTNATLEACAKILKTAGAKKVYGVIFAKN